MRKTAHSCKTPVTPKIWCWYEVGDWGNEKKIKTAHSRAVLFIKWRFYRKSEILGTSFIIHCPNWHFSIFKLIKMDAGKIFFLSSTEHDFFRRNKIIRQNTTEKVEFCLKKPPRTIKLSLLQKFEQWKGSIITPELIIFCQKPANTNFFYLVFEIWTI